MNNKFQQGNSFVYPLVVFAFLFSFLMSAIPVMGASSEVQKNSHFSYLIKKFSTIVSQFQSNITVVADKGEAPQLVVTITKDQYDQRETAIIEVLIQDNDSVFFVKSIEVDELVRVKVIERSNDPYSVMYYIDREGYGLADLPVIINVKDEAGNSSAETINIQFMSQRLTSVNAGAVATSLGVNLPNQIIGPLEQLKVATVEVTVSADEDQKINTLNSNLIINGSASISDLSKLVIKAKDYLDAGFPISTETSICDITITGITPTCDLSAQNLTISAGSTATFTYYVDGSAVGVIGAGVNPATDNISFSVNSQSGFVLLGVQSQVVVQDVSATNLVGRSVTPSGSIVRLVNTSPANRSESGKTGMVQVELDVIVGGPTITWTALSGTCYGSVSSGVCEPGNDDLDIILNAGPNTATGLALTSVNSSQSSYSLGSLSVPLALGTHTIKVLYNDNGPNQCSPVADTVQFGTNGFGYTVAGVGGTQNFITTQTSLISDFSTSVGNEIKHVFTFCG